jgi:hypothetical protein
MKKSVILLSLLGGAALAALLWKQYSQQATTEKAQTKKIAIVCPDIAQSCGNAQFSVHFKESPQVMKPLHLELVFLDGLSIQNVHAGFAMQDMEMGFNRYQLIKTADAKWVAEVILPVCLQGRSDWEMTLMIEDTEQQSRFLVPFSVPQR